MWSGYNEPTEQPTARQMIQQQPIVLDTLGKLADRGYCLAAACRTCGHTADGCADRPAEE
jgi:short subunit dehydrogenase-like uncharacterized protein